MDYSERQRIAQNVAAMTSQLSRLLDLQKMTTRELADSVLRCYLAGTPPETIVNMIILATSPNEN